MLELIISYISIWAPALVAMLGIAATVILSLGKVRAAIQEFKDEKTLAELYKKIDALTIQNAELTRCNKLLLDQLTKIQGYADQKNKEA